MTAWRHADAGDQPSLKSFVCYKPPVWAPNTPWRIKNNHQSWLRRIESLVRQLEPPVDPQENMLVCGIDEQQVVDGLIYAGTPHLNESNELTITVYLMARSIRSRGMGLGGSALGQLDVLALEAVQIFPNIETVFYRSVVHTGNHPCRALLVNSGWWEGDATDDPEYSEWWYSIAFED